MSEKRLAIMNVPYEYLFFHFFAVPIEGKVELRILTLRHPRSSLPIKWQECRVIDVAPNWGRNALQFKLESAEFDVVQYGCAIPYVDFSIEERHVKVEELDDYIHTPPLEHHRKPHSLLSKRVRVKGGDSSFVGTVYEVVPRSHDSTYCKVIWDGGNGGLVDTFIDNMLEVVGDVVSEVHVSADDFKHITGAMLIDRMKENNGGEIPQMAFTQITLTKDDLMNDDGSLIRARNKAVSDAVGIVKELKFATQEDAVRVCRDIVKRVNDCFTAIKLDEPLIIQEPCKSCGMTQGHAINCSK